ncbi:MAG: hypothetical protein ACLP9L_32700 [Thermoguttaceae bacterium]
MGSHDEKPAGLRPPSTLPVSPAQPDCLLTIGSQRFVAILAEECDSDLHVLIQGSPLFWVEDSGVLQRANIETVVKVSNIVRIEAVENQFASSVPAFRIGLVRLGQKAMKKGPRPAPIPLRKARRNVLSFLPLKRMPISVGGLAAVAMIATPLVFVAAAWQHHVRQARSADSQEVVRAAPEMPLSTPTVKQEPAAPAVPEPTPEILRLPGAEPFLNPEVAAKLELTPSQTGAFERLHKATQDAFVDLEKYWESGGRSELARRRDVLLDAARQEALQLLTHQQREQWEAMVR